MLAFIKIFDIIPGWAWAALFAAAVLVNCGNVAQRNAARVEAAEAKTALAQERQWSAEALAAETKKVWELQVQLTDAWADQEAKDAEAKSIIAGLHEDLRRRSRAGGGGGLRDPHAAACPRGAAPAQGAADAGADAADPPEAGGLLSAPLERLLLDTIAQADAINIAYASCHERTLTLERILNTQLSPPAPGLQVPAPP
jgi:hypothetical protein